MRAMREERGGERRGRVESMRALRGTMYGELRWWVWSHKAHWGWGGGEGEEDSKGSEMGAAAGTVGGIVYHHLASLLRPTTTGEQGQTVCLLSVANQHKTILTFPCHPRTHTQHPRNAPPVSVNKSTRLVD